LGIGLWIAVLVTSLTLGAFTSRFLAENCYYTLAGLSSPPQAALLTLGVALALLAFWRLYSVLWARQARISLNKALADDALTYIPLFLLFLYLMRKDVNPLQAKVLLCGCLFLVTALKVKALSGVESRKLRLVIGSGLFALTFVVYLSTLSPTVGEADSFEFQVVSYSLGVAHPSGYPLYVLLGKLFTLLPFGSVAYRVNLMSPLFASLAVVFLYLCLLDLTHQRFISALAALAFAFSRAFWSQAVIAEVYTLNAFFVALVLYLLLEVGSWKLEVGEAYRRIGEIAFVYGLSLTNHLTMALLAPAIAIYALLSRRRPTMGEGLLTEPPPPCSETLGHRRTFGFGISNFEFTEKSSRSRPRVRKSARGRASEQAFFRGVNFGFLLGLFLLGLSVYLYLPLRWPALHGRPMALGEFVNWVLGSRFRGALHWDAWLKDPERYLILSRLILEQYGWVGLILGLVGLVWLLAKRPREAIFLLIAYVTYFIYGLCYYVPDVSAFIIPAHLIFAIWIGAGLYGVLQATNRKLQDARTLLPCSPAPLLLCSLAALLPLPLLWTNLPQVDMSQHGWEAYRWGQYVLGLDVAPGAAILADSEKIAPLYYLQQVEGVRPDLDIIVMGDEAGYRQQLETRLAQGQTVYLARYLPGLEGRFHLRSMGPLVEVGTKPLTTIVLRPTSYVLGLDFGQDIRLLGYDADSLSIEPPGHLRLTLFWQALNKIDANYHVRLRLRGESGHVWLEEDGRHPVNGYYPTVAWRPGEIIPDFHELAISRALPPGTYALEVGLFPPFGQESVWEATIGRVHILEGNRWESPEDLAIPYPLRAIFDDELILLGYDRPSFARPNGKVTLTLYWQRLRESTVDYNIALQIVDEAGNVLWREGAPSLFGEYPTSRWGVGQIVQTSHELTMPATEGKVGLQVGLSNGSGEMLPVRCHWLARLSKWCPLRPTEVRRTVPTDRPAVNFDNKILLLGYDLSHRQLRPGEVLELSLTWQCLQRMDQDYTVFVHIIDEQQRIWGQEDIGPVQGTYPTSRWKEGEIIEDIHRVHLSYEAPPGEYRIEVGFYLLSTMARLPVLDEEMRAVDDKVIIRMTNDQ